MFKSMHAFAIDGKSRLVPELPLSSKGDENASSAREAVIKTVEGMLGRMPKASISVSNDISDLSSLVRVDKYEFVINDLGEGGKALAIRAYCSDPHDSNEIGEFVSVIEAAKGCLKALK